MINDVIFHADSDSIFRDLPDVDPFSESDDNGDEAKGDGGDDGGGGGVGRYDGSGDIPRDARDDAGDDGFGSRASGSGDPGPDSGGGGGGGCGAGRVMTRGGGCCVEDVAPSAADLCKSIVPKLRTDDKMRAMVETVGKELQALWHKAAIKHLHASFCNSEDQDLVLKTYDKKKPQTSHSSGRKVERFIPSFSGCMWVGDVCVCVCGGVMGV